MNSGQPQPEVAEKRKLTCMEIMGGNKAYDGAVSVPGIDAWIYSKPYGGDEAGGDIHYLSVCGGSKITRLAVADVSGHGGSVGELASQLRNFMRRYINRANQTRIVRHLNRSFLRQADGTHFATAIVATYFAPSEDLIICNAGHPPPLLYRASKKTWHELNPNEPETSGSAANLPLGIISETKFYQYAVKLEVDDLVLFYTDGLPETADADGKQLGQAGLLKLVGEIDVDDQESFVASLRSRLAEFRGGAEEGDDITAILIRHNAARAPRPSLGENLKVIGKLLHLVKV
ncbi:MAG TPA: PP2C family protein-serine/threonine phosphatase [Phycisphaerae bacterium]|nr:PP2C family protein-serine/threonine phosphatase [Phycisphaerae bacterium]